MEISSWSATLTYCTMAVTDLGAAAREAKPSVECHLAKALLSLGSQSRYRRQACQRRLRMCSLWAPH